MRRGTEVSCRFAVYDKAPPKNRIGEYVLDANDSATIQLSLENGALGTINSTRAASGHINDLRLRVYGTKGGLEIANDGSLSPATSPSLLRACLSEDLTAAKWRTIECDRVPTNYERFIAALRGEQSLPLADFARGAEIQKVLDAAEVSAKKFGLTVSL